MRSLLSTITDKALASFDKVPAIEYWDEWCEHWFEVAEQFRKELEDEGLVETVKKVEYEIDWQRKIVGNIRKFN